jgi:hypothetical protein
MKKLIVKSAIRLILIAVLVVILSSLAQSPIIDIELTLGQMENSNLAFIAMDSYGKVKPIVQAVLSLIGVYLIAGVGVDICKYAKTYYETKLKKENN